MDIVNRTLFTSFVSVLICSICVSMCLAANETTDDVIYHDYCIIGAGPGGLQTAYFLHRANRDYIVFERSNTAGNFFVTYPRHRRLISINKRFTGQKSAEFNLRHDWNSLLSDNPDLLMTKYSEEMFPDADVLVKYLQDYKERLGLKVKFDSEVNGLHKRRNSTAPDGHVFVMSDQRGASYVCRTVIMATGLHKPNIPSTDGIEHAVGYEDMSLNPRDYEGKSVLILGRGNTAFEIATSIYGSTNFIHMMARSRLRLAYQTHYVGDLRAINNELLDTYQLKSLDGLTETDLEDSIITREKDKFRIGFGDPSLIGEKFDNDAFRKPYDVIIRALGFTFDGSIFNDTAISRGQERAKKYPAISHNYESRDHTGLFYAGTAAHSLDFRQSSGGFIHGFRYTARALTRLLDQRYHGDAWPVRTFPTGQLLNNLVKRVNEASGPYQMFGMLGDIALFSEDGGTVTYIEEFPVRLLADLDKYTGLGDQIKGPMLVVLLEYGKNFSGPGKDVFGDERATSEPSEAHNSNFLHPVLYHYTRQPTASEMDESRPAPLPRPSSIHHVVEDFLGEFTAQYSHLLPLRRFIEHITQSDLRGNFAETCLSLALTHSSLPPSCQTQFIEGQGLMPTTLGVHSFIGSTIA